MQPFEQKCTFLMYVKHYKQLMLLMYSYDIKREQHGML